MVAAEMTNGRCIDGKAPGRAPEGPGLSTPAVSSFLEVPFLEKNPCLNDPNIADFFFLPLTSGSDPELATDAGSTAHNNIIRLSCY